MRKYFFFFALLVLAGCSQNTKTSLSDETGKKYDLYSDTSVYSGEMKRYWLVLLKKGANRTQDSASAAKIQAAHLANIGRLADEDKIIMAGPIGMKGDIQGIYVMNCRDSAEVEKLVKTDTAVMTGRLIMEYYPWWFEKGKYIFK